MSTISSHLEGSILLHVLSIGFDLSVNKTLPEETIDGCRKCVNSKEEFKESDSSSLALFAVWWSTIAK